MATVRDAILEGTSAAAKLHDELGLRAATESNGGGIDVFGALLRLDATLLFRPLDGLLGACLAGPSRGVLISTQRPLRIQRFTGAHELGHVVMGHQDSLDGEEILARSPNSKNPQEVAADAFAAEFLIPKWLLQAHARRQGWNRISMTEPRIVYQLSLRIGASYDATCRALDRDSIIDANTRERLLSVKPKQIKQALLDGIELRTWTPDVWLLSEKDAGLTIEGQPDDLFVFRLTERGASGYLWDIDGLRAAGFVVLRDQREIPPPEHSIGGPVTRAFTARPSGSDPVSGDLSLELRRPWNKTGSPLSRLNVLYNLFGREVGIPRALRRQLLAA